MVEDHPDQEVHQLEEVHLEEEEAHLEVVHQCLEVGQILEVQHYYWQEVEGQLHQVD